ncbi:uncharacterized protein (TIGR00369 family) [Melghirimyces profundicolus]|uniref:Uncharacterized protein (TIGR00369 family) n=1 Tax=Melghirimyces profundicolus TaxID=1242148 RepID=A0A2T6BQK6_9BACL|nr:PaaI family thioesterase [Melghirimyces profundicolus]PTX58334.1 uncharacterized protein (TIGR00369 family) [Melghirimyces profundicolus]
MDLTMELNEVLQTGTDEEKEILRLALQAIRQKRERGSAYPSGFLGLSGEFTEEGTYRFRVPITPYTLNRGGIVHGGITATLADSTMGSLINKSLPEGKAAVTVEMKINYLEAGTGKELISEARLIRLGHTLAFADCKVENETGKRIAHATGTFAILRFSG